MARIDLVTLVVRDYDEAIAFFRDAVGFELTEDSPSEANDGTPKRWVVMRPPGGGTGLLLAEGRGERQVAAIGEQAGGRVTFFLHVDDFAASFQRLVDHGVEIVRPARREPYGQVAVFRDIAGNLWDLLGD